LLFQITASPTAATITTDVMGGMQQFVEDELQDFFHSALAD
jgi:hypothetical protein